MTGSARTPVAEANAEQARAWDGDEGSFWAAHADAFDDAVRDHHARLLAAAGITPGERVLDVGCGTGQTTRDAARLAGASEQMYFGATADEAVALVSGLMAWLLAELDDDARMRALDTLRASMQAHAGPRGVSYGSAAWIITAHR